MQSDVIKIEYYFFIKSTRKCLSIRRNIELSLRSYVQMYIIEYIHIWCIQIWYTHVVRVCGVVMLACTKHILTIIYHSMDFVDLLYSHVILILMGPIINITNSVAENVCVISRPIPDYIVVDTLKKIDDFGGIYKKNGSAALS